MGQYRQWLHYREVDQLLRAQLGALEQQLAQFQEQAHLLEHDRPSPENAILQALVAQILAGEYPSPHLIAPDAIPDTPHDPSIFSHPPSKNHPSVFSAPATTESEPSTETVSPALFAWSRLPNFISQDLREPIAPVDSQSPVPTTPPPDEGLLPEDMAAFVDEHTQTAPRLEIPWWLRNTALSRREEPAKGPSTHGPIDYQSVRTNRLVQRWFERWGQYPLSPHDAEEKQEK